MKITLVLFLLMLSVGSFAQVRVDGQVADSLTKENIPFATIIIKNKQDTTFVKSTISALNGAYSFPNIPVGEYEIIIQSLGYKPLTEGYDIVIPATGFVIKRSDVLIPNQITLGEVQIVGNRKSQTADRRIFTFTAKEMREAMHSYDLIKKLPLVQEDLVNEKLQGVRGGAILILINGVKATYNDVRMIPTNKIKRVEAYDIPPIRYQNVEGVINIITSALDDGFSIGGELNHAIATGFGNDNAYFALMRGKHKLSFQYTYNLRDYDNKDANTEYRYNIQGLDYKLSYHSKERFGYKRHTPSLKYSFFDEDKTVWEVTLKPNVESRFNKEKGDGSYNKGNVDIKQLATEQDNNIHILNPSLDIYLWKKVSKEDELSVNAVATIFKTKRNSWGIENNKTDNSLVFEDKMNLLNNKYSLIGELTYTKSLSIAKWTNGYRSEYASLHSDIKNTFGDFKDKRQYFSQFIYSELSGTYKKLLYRVSLGLTHTQNKSDFINYKQILFTPKIVLGYSIGKGHTLRFMYDRLPIAPSINSLSNNKSYISKDIISVGNPLLENEISETLTAIYSYQNKYADINLAGVYQYHSKPIISYFEEKDGTYQNISINGKWLKEFAIALTGSWKPFGNDNFKIDLLVLPSKMSVNSDMINYSITAWNNRIGATFNHKGLTLNYQYSIPVYSLQDGYRTLSENNHHFYMKYKYKNWRFSTGLLFIGDPSHYNYQTVSGSKVYHSFDSRIYNNKNMFTFGVAYHFSTGKEKAYNKKINNQDNSVPIR